jgi:hypothetical protein
MLPASRRWPRRSSCTATPTRPPGRRSPPAALSSADDDLRSALRLIDPSLGVEFAIGDIQFLRQTA